MQFIIWIRCNLEFTISQPIHQFVGWAGSKEDLDISMYIPTCISSPITKQSILPQVHLHKSITILHLSLLCCSNVPPHLKKMTSGTGRRSARSRVKSSVTDDDLNSGNSKPSPKFRTHKARNNNINNLNFNLKLLLGFGLFAFSVSLFFIYRLVNFTGDVDDKILRIVTPFPSPKLTHLPMVLSRISFRIELVNDNYVVMYVCVCEMI